jgi:hypothetical protein
MGNPVIQAMGGVIKRKRRVGRPLKDNPCPSFGVIDSVHLD